MIEISKGGLALGATEAEASVVPLGVQVEFHPSISPGMQAFALETALRLWKAEIGAVTRGGAPSFARSSAWLPGWTIRRFEGKPVRYLRIALREEEDTVEAVS